MRPLELRAWSRRTPRSRWCSRAMKSTSIARSPPLAFASSSMASSAFDMPDERGKIAAGIELVILRADLRLRRASASATGDCGLVKRSSPRLAQRIESDDRHAALAHAPAADAASADC